MENDTFLHTGEVIPFHERERAMQNRIKMRHLEAVIALAEEMHYGRAAKRIGLTQSGMTRCIQSAKREANTTLFERDRSRIKLTDAGRPYVEHARISIAFGERAMRSAKEAQAGEDTVLQIGKLMLNL